MKYITLRRGNGVSARIAVEHIVAFWEEHFGTNGTIQYNTAVKTSDGTTWGYEGTPEEFEQYLREFLDE